MAKISRTRGKNFELDVARYMGIKREHFEKNDLKGHPLFTFECKKRSKLPAFLIKAFAQATAACEDGKAPALVLGEQQKGASKALVVIRLSDLRDIVG